MSTIRDLLEGGAHALGNQVGGRLRYGVPLEEKARMAVSGEIPGYDPVNAGTEIGQDIEQRRAAAYLFGKTHPNLGPEWQPIIDRYIRSGDDPRVLAVTQSAVEQGAMDAQRGKQEHQDAETAMRQRLIARFGQGLGALLGLSGADRRAGR